MLPKRSSIRVLLLVAFYIFYIVIGAAIFSAVEGPVEKSISNDMKVSREKFLLKHRCLTEIDLDNMLSEVIEANNHGVSALRNVTEESNWSFGQSIFFATSILTTIGYGHVTPLSDGGKCFSVVYAALGIPLTLILFTALVERLLILTNITQQALIARLGHLYRSLHIRLIHVSILVLLLLILVFIIPAAVFMTLEDHWNYLDAFYYCFISMTTIGLGDYIPGDNYRQPLRPIYKIGTAIYLVVGLICMMLVLANVYDIPELNFGNHFYMRNDTKYDDVIEDEEHRKLRSTNEGAGEQTKYGAEGTAGKRTAAKGSKSGGRQRADDQETLVDE